MVNAVVLDNVEHQNLRLNERRGPEFGDGVNESPVFPSEMIELAREYAIYFRQTQRDGVQAFALLGLDAGENLFVENGEWRARRIPAMMQRGPFSIGVRESEGVREPAIMLDLDDPRVGESSGTPLFLPHGGQSAVLQRAADALRIIHQGLQDTPKVFAAFLSEGLIAPLQIDVRLDDRTNYALHDVLAISEEALSGLSPEALHRLNSNGLLSLAFHLRASLSNINTVIERKSRKRAQD